jgi:hypothetical protein
MNLLNHSTSSSFAEAIFDLKFAAYCPTLDDVDESLLFLRNGLKSLT